MHKPNESLDDFSVKPLTGSAAKPPREVSLQLTGEIQTLEPLADPMMRHTDQYTFRPNLRKQPIWFRRFIAVGGGAIVLVAIALVSAIIVGISEPASAPEVAMNVSAEPELAQTGAPFGVDGYSSPDSETAANGVEFVSRANGVRRSGRRNIRLARYKRRPVMSPVPRPETRKFFPTTLVIYAENGVIKSRIEPWL